MLARWGRVPIGIGVADACDAHPARNERRIILGCRRTRSSAWCLTIFAATFLFAMAAASFCYATPDNLRHHRRVCFSSGEARSDWIRLRLTRIERPRVVPRCLQLQRPKRSDYLSRADRDTRAVHASVQSQQVDVSVSRRAPTWHTRSCGWPHHAAFPAASCHRCHARERAGGPPRCSQLRIPSGFAGMSGDATPASLRVPESIDWQRKAPCCAHSHRDPRRARDSRRRDSINHTTARRATGRGDEGTGGGRDEGTRNWHDDRRTGKGREEGASKPSPPSKPASRTRAANGAPTVSSTTRPRTPARPQSAPPPALARTHTLSLGRFVRERANVTLKRRIKHRRIRDHRHQGPHAERRARRAAPWIVVFVTQPSSSPQACVACWTCCRSRHGRQQPHRGRCHQPTGNAQSRLARTPWAARPMALPLAAAHHSRGQAPASPTARRLRARCRTSKDPLFPAASRRCNCSQAHRKLRAAQARMWTLQRQHRRRLRRRGSAPVVSLLRHILVLNQAVAKLTA